jgi:hypothetical protein
MWTKSNGGVPFTTKSKNVSSHQLKGKIHFITVHIMRMKPFIDTVKKSSKKNLYYVLYFMSAYIFISKVVNQMRIYNFNELLNGDTVGGNRCEIQQSDMIYNFRLSYSFN